MIDYLRDGQEIYRQSFATIRAEADLSRIPPDLEKLAVRVIHACGMVDVVYDLRFSEGAGAAGRAALAAGAPILCDARMVAEGITRARLPAGNRVLSRGSSATRARPPRSNCGARTWPAASSRSATRRPRCSICST